MVRGTGARASKVMPQQAHSVWLACHRASQVKALRGNAVCHACWGRPPGSCTCGPGWSCGGAAKELGVRGKGVGWGGEDRGCGGPGRVGSCPGRAEGGWRGSGADGTSCTTRAWSAAGRRACARRQASPGGVQTHAGSRAPFGVHALPSPRVFLLIALFRPAAAAGLPHLRTAQMYHEMMLAAKRPSFGPKARFSSARPWKVRLALAADDDTSNANSRSAKSRLVGGLEYAARLGIGSACGGRRGQVCVAMRSGQDRKSVV